MQCSMRKAMCRFLFEAHSFQLSILVLISSWPLIVIIFIIIVLARVKWALTSPDCCYGLVVVSAVNASQKSHAQMCALLTRVINIPIGDEVDDSTGKVKKAALTYVASAAASILQLLRLLILTGGRRRDD